MAKFWRGFLLGFAALFVFFPFGINNLKDEEDSVVKSWENLGIYFRKALMKYDGRDQCGIYTATKRKYTCSNI